MSKDGKQWLCLIDQRDGEPPVVMGTVLEFNRDVRKVPSSDGIHAEFQAGPYTMVTVLPQTEPVDRRPEPTPPPPEPPAAKGDCVLTRLLLWNPSKLPHCSECGKELHRLGTFGGLPLYGHGTWNECVTKEPDPTPRQRIPTVAPTIQEMLATTVELRDRRPEPTPRPQEPACETCVRHPDCDMGDTTRCPLARMPSESEHNPPYDSNVPGTWCSAYKGEHDDNDE